jgi:hypothetical protein
MRIRLLRTFTRLWKSFFGRRLPIVVSTAHAETDRVVARGRFWTEFRDGQREAEAHSSKLR